MAKRVLRHKTTLVGKSLESIRSSNYAKSDSCYDIFATVRGQAILATVSTLIALLYNWLLPQLTPNFLWAQPPLTDFLMSPQLNWVWSLCPAAQPSDWTGSFKSDWRISGYSLSCNTLSHSASLNHFSALTIPSFMKLFCFGTCNSGSYITSSLPPSSTAEMSLFSDFQLWTSSFLTLYVLSSLLLWTEWLCIQNPQITFGLLTLKVRVQGSGSKDPREWVFVGA